MDFKLDYFFVDKYFYFSRKKCLVNTNRGYYIRRRIVHALAQIKMLILKTILDPKSGCPNPYSDFQFSLNQPKSPEALNK